MLEICKNYVVLIVLILNSIDLFSDTLRKEAPPHLGWMTLWEGNPRKHIMLAVHYSWAIFIIIFNSMVLNIRAFGREHLHINTAIIGNGVLPISITYIPKLCKICL